MLNLLREKLHTVRGIEPKYVDINLKKKVLWCLYASLHVLSIDRNHDKMLALF